MEVDVELRYCAVLLRQEFEVSKNQMIHISRVPDRKAEEFTVAFPQRSQKRAVGGVRERAD